MEEIARKDWPTRDPWGARDISDADRLEAEIREVCRTALGDGLAHDKAAFAITLALRRAGFDATVR